jgi:hypothetical protein
MKKIILFLLVVTLRLSVSHPATQQKENEAETDGEKSRKIIGQR